MKMYHFSLAVVLALCAQQSSAATVTTLADSGPGSLRAAIAAGGVITFDVTGTISLTSGELAVNVPVIIQGPGASQLTIERSRAAGTPDFRVLNVRAAAQISGVTLSNGRVGAVDGYEDGGCVMLGGNLTLRDCAITGNNSVGNWTRGTAINVERAGRLSAVNCLFTGNVGTGFSAEGSAIYNHGLVTLTNCTFSGNSAGYSAAIQNDGFSDGLIIESCTIVSNRARFTAGLYNGGSAGWFAGEIEIHNSIVAGNTAWDYYDGPDLDISNDGNFISTGYNLIGKVWDVRSPIHPHLTDRTGLSGAELHLAPLADNGGPTLTHALLLGSPAVDTGAPNNFPPTDQRGVPRPFGPYPDVGAFEANVMLPLTLICPPVQIVDATSSAGAEVSLEVTVTDAEGRPVTVLWSVNGVPRATNTSIAVMPGSPVTFSYTAMFPKGMSEVVVTAANGVNEPISCSCAVQVRDPSAPNTVYVNSLLDSGFGTLRQAVATVPTNGTIVFSVAGVINLTRGELRTDRPMKIVGPGADLLTIQRSEHPDTSAFRIIHAWQGPLAISGVTIRNGNLPGTVEDDGAGIDNWTDLTLDKVVIRDNRLGGSAARGAGLQNRGHIRATACTFVNNAVLDRGGEGGAIYNYNALYLTNCTLSGNSALNSGGAMHNDAFASTVVIHSCTIVDNSAEQGSAIYNNGFANERVNLFIVNSIVAANPGLYQHDIYESALTTSGGHNLFGTISGNTIIAQPGDRFGVTAAQLQLGPLQNNGGATPTHALLGGSIAIDAGSDSNCLPTDQRGVARPHYVRCDIGAFEADQLSPTVLCPNPVFIDCSAPDAVTLTATVHDMDGDPVAVIWFLNGTAVQTNSVPSGSGTVSLTARFGQGTNVVAVWASDGILDPVMCSTTVTVGDRQPPVIHSLTADPSILRPANQQMTGVTLRVQAADNCSAVSSRIIGVTSSDPISGTFRGDRSPDWQITGPLTLRIRAETSTRWRPRIYTITIESRDASGNAATRSVTVTVPATRRSSDD